MEEGLLLYRIDVDGTGKAIHHAPQPTVQIDPDAAIATLPRPDETLLGTQLALNVRHDWLPFCWKADKAIVGTSRTAVNLRDESGGMTWRQSRRHA
jgi:hypothetical protein